MLVQDQKRFLRQKALANRAIISPEEAEIAAATLAHEVFPLIVESLPEGGVVSGFYPYKNEISCLALFGRLVQAGFVTALPVVRCKGEPLIFRRWQVGEPLVKDKWEIDMPPAEAHEVTPDFLLVPFLAFDRRGYRLGYGGGFYDRTLAGLRAQKTITAIGIGFADQEVELVPHDGFDQRLDGIATDKEMIRCG